MNKKLALAILIVVFLISAGFPNFTGFAPSDPRTEAFVTRVIDGDTIVLEDDERVRLLGIDTPERGEYYFEEAKEKLKEMVDNKTVLLEKDKEERDKYSRLLRYVWLDEILTSLELVREGYARTFMLEQGDKYYEELTAAELEAIESRLGIWEFPENLNS